MTTNESQSEPPNFLTNILSIAMAAVLVILALASIFRTFDPRADAYRVECERRGGWVETMARSAAPPRCNNAKPPMPTLNDWQP